MAEEIITISGTVRHKLSTEKGKIPKPENIGKGEIALNLPDKAMYTKDENGNVVRLNPIPSATYTKITSLMDILV